jgi:hypothetical protein
MVRHQAKTHPAKSVCEPAVAVKCPFRNDLSLRLLGLSANAWFEPGGKIVPLQLLPWSGPF